MNVASHATENRSQSHGLYIKPGMLRERWSNEDLRLASTLMAMDTVENWTFDGHPETEKAMESLCNIIEQTGSDIVIGSASRDFLLIMAYMRSSRAVHMLSVLDRKFAGAGLKLVQRAAQLTAKDIGGDASEATLMIERMETLRRINALRRIFSPSRLRLVLKALEELNDEAEY